MSSRERLGRPLDRDRLHVELALPASHRLGATVLGADRRRQIADILA